jgi:hypothetical protein
LKKAETRQVEGLLEARGTQGRKYQQTSLEEGGTDKSKVKESNKIDFNLKSVFKDREQPSK